MTKFCQAYGERFYLWVVSFSLIAVAVAAVAGTAWIVNEKRAG